MLPPPAMKTRRDRLVELAQLAHHGADVAPVGEEEDLVVDLDHGVALGHDRLAARGRSPRRARRRRPAGARAARGSGARPARRPAGAHRDQLGAAVGEVEHLQRAGILDQALHVAADQRLGADRHVDRRAAALISSGCCRYSISRTRAILVGVLNSASATWQAMMLTSSLRGHRDHQVGVLGAGLRQHARDARRGRRTVRMSSLLGQLAQLAAGRCRPR